MAKWFQHEEHGSIQAALEAYRSQLDADQPTNGTLSPDRVRNAADAGEVLADRIGMALRSTDWRRVEAAQAEKAKSR